MSYAAYREGFAAALDPALYTLEYLDWLMETGRGLFWATDSAAILAEVKTYPTGATAICGLCACGELAEIARVLIPQAESWGRDNGCTFSIIESRGGWERVLKHQGYARHQIALRKAI